MTLHDSPLPPLPPVPNPAAATALDFSWLHLIALPQPDHTHCDELGIPFADLPMCQ